MNCVKIATLRMNVQIAVLPEPPSYSWEEQEGPWVIRVMNASEKATEQL